LRDADGRSLFKQESEAVSGALGPDGRPGVEGSNGNRSVIGIERPSPPPPPSPQEQDIINLFCRYRAPGIHEIATLCDIFVSCSVAGVATVIPCPNGTRFNPEVLNCDHSRQYECFEPGFDGKISNL